MTWLARKALRVSGPPPIGDVNKMRDGSLSSLAQLSPTWFAFTAARVNDGTKVFVDPYYNNPALSADQTVSSNLGRGFTITFTAALALRRFKIYGDDAGGVIRQYNWRIQAYVAGAWVTVSTQAMPYAIPGIFDFNADLAISSTQWRLIVVDWVALFGNNYIFEIEAYI